MATWPPTLDETKLDMGQKYDAPSTRDDDRLELDLAASVAFVERVRPLFNYQADPMSELPDPTDDLKLGTMRLAARWFTRRNSPDALVAMAELGAGRVPSFDPDIDRMLGIGKYRGPVFA